MNALAPDLAASEIDRRNAARRHLHAGDCARHPVDEHRARGKFRPLERGADESVVTDRELHRHLDAARVVEAVRAQAEIAAAEVELNPLRLAPVVAAGVKAQVAAADQAIHRLSGSGYGERSRGECQESRKCEMTHG